ncbi:IS3 family transposase [Zooshikella sp. RANM57]|uniref:IS3 family transposase n=1 Tax=Zooshikella sp. RANM57 TaxID=3425863 RepID=UPI003D6ED4DF
MTKIKRAWLESGGMHGYRNIHQDLIDLKVKCGRDRVYRLMKAEGLKAQRSAKDPRPYYGGKPEMVAQNWLAQDFFVEALD